MVSHTWYYTKVNELVEMNTVKCSLPEITKQKEVKSSNIFTKIHNYWLDTLSFDMLSFTVKCFYIA